MLETMSLMFEMAFNWHAAKALGAELWVVEKRHHHCVKKAILWSSHSRPPSRTKEEVTHGFQGRRPLPAAAITDTC